MPTSWTLVVVLSDSFCGKEHGETPRRPNSRTTPQGLNLISKKEELEPKWQAEEAQMRKSLDSQKKVAKSCSC